MKRGKTRNAARLGILLIALMLLSGLIGSSPQAAQPWKVSSVDLVGADGANNTTAFVNDRYIMVAPYAPSKMPTEAAAVDELDNYSIYLVDMKKPSDGLQSHVIESQVDHKRLYYPTKLVFDDKTSIVYVRGTRYEKTDDGVKEIAALAYMHVNLDVYGKPTFDDDVVIFDIAGVGEATTPDAPDDLRLVFGGDLLLFTNGASVFTYNVNHGYLYRVDLVKAEAYDAGARIAYLDVDEATRTLSVYWNQQVQEKETVKNHTELSFYDLSGDGTMQLQKRLYPEDFPEGVYITAGSSIEVLAPITVNNNFIRPALVATSDGSLFQVDLNSTERAASLKRLVQFDAMATGSEGGPRILKLDISKRMAGIVRQGYTAQIRKPANGRPGKGGSVIRTLSLFNSVEPPALAIARFNKGMNKVLASKVFSDDFRGEDGLTPLIDGQDSQWMLATRSGKVLALSTTDATESLGLSVLTQIGSRTGRIDYSASRDSVVAINSYGLDAAAEQIAEPGELLVARRLGSAVQNVSTASAATVTSTVSPSERGGQSPTPSIRRPCNISKK
ncbi:MAG: hypothetical protein ACJ74J_10330 [Blastocatellia bacterium]